MLTLSAFELVVSGVVVLLLLVVVAGIAFTEGGERTARRLRKQAAENGVDWRWISAPLPEESE